MGRAARCDSAQELHEPEALIAKPHITSVSRRHHAPDFRSIAISDMKEEDRPEWYDQAH